mmetsp:Transcript_14762/g.26702  ORF Transcript_14762/g.26702 Transcript_14762/m.26702 type:complete len:96 (+) Transcript_14762:37-324(+)
MSYLSFTLTPLLKGNPVFLMSNTGMSISSTTSNRVLSVVTHFLAVLNAIFGFMLYVDPDYYLTNFNDVSFDTIMTYAARMFGVGHALYVGCCRLD